MDPLAPDFLQCPYPTYARLRAEEPVTWVDHGKGFFLVTTHELCLAVLRDTDTFSSAIGNPSTTVVGPELAARLKEVQGAGYQRVPTLVATDPPTHTDHRRLVARRFSTRAVQALEPDIREIAEALVAGWPVPGELELVGDFAVPFPIRVIARVLGLDEDRVDDFKRWSDAATAELGSDMSDDERCAAAQDIVDFQHYFVPRLGDLAPELDTPGRLGIALQLLTAGNETTTKLLAETMRVLAALPDWWARIREDRTVIPAVVEEMLRVASPSAINQRRTTRDTQLGGVDIPAGSYVLVVNLSANRDETLYPDPDRFDPSRDTLGDHVAFGFGAHFCLGASLARTEARIALDVIADRVERFEVVEPDSLEYIPTFMLRGLRSLPLRVF